jgi:hypothetical protein
VVRESVPPYAIVTGNPAVVVGYRHTKEQITALLEIQWWLWEGDKLFQAMPFLLADDVQVFVDQFGGGAERRKRFFAEAKAKPAFYMKL